MGFKKLIPQNLINFFWHLPQAILANIIYGFPGRKLTVIGITGTSGKTTTAHLLYHILKQAGFKVELISTIFAPGLHVTNPNPFVLQKILRQLVNKGTQCLVLEVTSHGLDQYRNWGIKFKYGLITNITHEHLDYHKTFANYQKSKLKLLKIAEVPIKFQDSDDFTKANQNAAAAIAEKMGLSRSDINRAIKTFPGIPGRMEIIQAKPFKIVIDFAHKPDALIKALTVLRSQKKGRLISLFGCAGLRDTQKRPLMGEISSRLADITILTSEDPRTENPDEIINQIKSGITNKSKVYCQSDRQKAIDLAIKLARSGDTVALFGKSHEKSMCFGTIEYPWSEHQAVKKSLCKI